MDKVTKSNQSQKPASDSGLQGRVDGAWRGAFDAFGEIFERISKNPAPAAIIITAYVVFAEVNERAGIIRHLPHSAYYNLSSILYFVFLLALQVYALALADGKPISVAEFMRFDPKKYLVLFLGNLLMFGIVFISVLCFVVPVIWTLAWFSLFTYVVVDKSTGVVDAFKESKRLMQDNKSKIWGIIGLAVMMYIAISVLTIAVVWLPYVGTALVSGADMALAIIVTGAGAMLYRWLQRNVPASPENMTQAAVPADPVK